MPLQEFMGEAVATYYAQGTAFGAAGDFITAPEISQIFGELLGLWAATVWQGRGGGPIQLVELGPGRGTLMADALRAITNALPAFVEALSLHLVEASPALRDQQRQALGNRPITWHDTVDSLPAGPMILIANEFLDALPIVQHAHGIERCVIFDQVRKDFVFADGDIAPEHIQESSPAINTVITALGHRLGRDGGAALFIDYGYSQTAPGDTLQALAKHQKVPPLSNPGAVDLTAHVDFAAVRHAAEVAGATAHGPLTQGRFLAQLGIEQRAAALIRRATPQQAIALDQGFRRLLHPDEMGTLFKIIALTGKDGPTPPGFEGLITS